MKKILLTTILLGMALSLMAIPARPGRFPYVQPDGSTILIEMHGDEFNHWITAADGTELEWDNGFYRPSTRSSEKRKEMRRQGESRRRMAYEAQQVARSQGIATGRKHFLVILIEFDDEHFTVSNPQDAFTRLLNEPGYSTNGATGSARDYYYENSNGSFEPIFDVVGPVRLSKGYAYYGQGTNGSDLHADEALFEACKLLDDEIDFSAYDYDGDNFVDLVFYYYAGTNEAEGGGEDRIWPHKFALYNYYNSAVFDNVRVYDYACTSEKNYLGTMCGIGTACHEFGHAMGLPDMYDTDGTENGTAGALYSYSIMCSGSYNNAGRTPPYFNMQERIYLGWNEESDIREITTGGTLSIPALNGTQQMVYKIPTDVEGEYFMLETRAQSGWDAALPGQGLLVYHIDKSSNRVGYTTAARLWNWSQTGNRLNAYGSHPCCYLIPAASPESLDFFGSESAIPFPYRAGHTVVTAYTPVDWAGENATGYMENISYSAGTATMTVYFPPDDISQYGYHFIDNPGNGVYTAGKYFTFKLIEAETNPPSSVKWFYDGSAKNNSGSVKLTAGTHKIEARLTYADGTVESIYLTITVN